MSGFIRRYPGFPSKDIIQQIEGVIIVDTPPSGTVQGVGTGVAALVGEFADMTYGVTVDASGNVTTSYLPVEIVSAQDQIDKLGGWDETLGKFGAEMGNGFVELKNKMFDRLIVVPINLSSNKGIRLWRQLPTCKSATDPTPITALQGAVVAAGREFKSGTAQRVRTCKRVLFTGLDARCSGIDADTATIGAAAFQNITLPTGNLVINNVQKGDLLVLGVIGGAGYLGSNANTYRVISVTSATVMVIEMLDGSSFALTDESSAAQPWRIHPGSTGDSGGINQLSDVGGCTIPARPLDSTVVAATLITPTVTPPANAANAWDVLSGLTARTMTGGALTFTAAVQAPNVANSATVDALYDVAFDALKSQEFPVSDINLIWAARKSATIRAKVRQHCLDVSALGRGRRGFVSPLLTDLTLQTNVGDAAPGVGATRAERIAYNWPGVQTYIREAVGFSIATPTGQNTTDGMIDVTSDGWNAAVCSILPPERNPAQGAPPVDAILGPIVSLQRGAPKLDMSAYSQMRQRGICAPRYAKELGHFEFQSGITSSLVSGEKNQNRRAMADYLEDSLASALISFSKLPMTDALKSGAVGEVDAFLDGLLSANNAAAQRIADYIVDAKSGNTNSLTAAGIFVIIVRVQLVPTADFIVLQAEVGEGVLNVTSQTALAST